jgi:hypothetical protein
VSFYLCSRLEARLISFGTGSIVPQSASCYTSVDGSVVGTMGPRKTVVVRCKRVPTAMATDRIEPMPKRTKARPVTPKPLGEEDYPTVDEINALPDRFRRYIHDLATRADKTDDLRTIVHLRQDRESLQKRVEELEAEVASIRGQSGA